MLQRSWCSTSTTSAPAQLRNCLLCFPALATCSCLFRHHSHGGSTIHSLRRCDAWGISPGLHVGNALAAAVGGSCSLVAGTQGGETVASVRTWPRPRRKSTTAHSLRCVNEHLLPRCFVCLKFRMLSGFINTGHRPLRHQTNGPSPNSSPTKAITNPPHTRGRQPSGRNVPGGGRSQTEVPAGVPPSPPCQSSAAPGFWPPRWFRQSPTP